MTLWQRLMALFGREYILSKTGRDGWRVQPVRFIGSHYYTRSSSDNAWEKVHPIQMTEEWMPVTKGIEAWAIMVHDVELPITTFQKHRKQIIEAARTATFAASESIESDDRTKIRESFERKFDEILAP